MAARTGKKPRLSTEQVLEAVSVLGRRWTMMFADEEIVVVNEALDRELLAGNLANAYTVAPQGRALLESEGRSPVTAHLDLRIDQECLTCRRDRTCWVLQCTSCQGFRVEHLAESEVLPAVLAAVDDHRCQIAQRAG